jgi:hypothetical protein
MPFGIVETISGGKTRAVTSVRASPTAAAGTASTRLSTVSCRATPTAGPKREPDPDLALPAEGARQQEVRHVRAGNEEDERKGRPEEREQRHRQRIPGDATALEFDPDRGGHGVGSSREPLAEPHIEPGACLRLGRALPQAPDDEERRRAQVGSRKRRRHRQGCPEGHAHLTPQSEPRRGDADDVEALAPERDRLSDDVRVGTIARAPGAIGEHDDRRAARSRRVRGRDPAPARRSTTQHLKVVASDQKANEWNLVPHDEHLPAGNQAGERRCVLADVVEVRKGQSSALCGFCVPAERVELMRVWQVDRPEEVSVEDGEGRAEDAEPKADGRRDAGRK